MVASARIQPAELDVPKAPAPRSERVMTRFSKREMAELEKRAQDFGGVRKWLVALARAQIAPGVPQFTPAALKALYESNRDLAAIGRNVNQIAHALNLDLQQSGQLRTSVDLVYELATMKQIITANTYRVMALAPSPRCAEPGMSLPSINPLRCRRRTTEGPVRPKRGKPPSIKHFAARLARVAKNSPEVFVKVSGSGKSRAHTLAHLTYITRNGKLEAENERGEKIVGKEGVKEVFNEWGFQTPGNSERKRAQTVNIVLSMPEGTDAQAVLSAAPTSPPRSSAETNNTCSCCTTTPTIRTCTWR